MQKEVVLHCNCLANQREPFSLVFVPMFDKEMEKCDVEYGSMVASMNAAVIANKLFDNVTATTWDNLREEITKLNDTLK